MFMKVHYTFRNKINSSLSLYHFETTAAGVVHRCIAVIDLLRMSLPLSSPDLYDDHLLQQSYSRQQALGTAKDDVHGSRVGRHDPVHCKADAVQHCHAQLSRGMCSSQSSFCTYTVLYLFGEVLCDDNQHYGIPHLYYQREINTNKKNFFPHSLTLKASTSP